MREELSVCEAPIMKIIWESNPDISVPELVKQLNEQYGKEYARTTVVTFLTRMAEFAQTLCAAAPLTHEECQKLRRLLDHVEEK